MSVVNGLDLHHTYEYIRCFSSEWMRENVRTPFYINDLYSMMMIIIIVAYWQHDFENIAQILRNLHAIFASINLYYLLSVESTCPMHSPHE